MYHSLKKKQQQKYERGSLQSRAQSHCWVIKLRKANRNVYHETYVYLRHFSVIISGLHNVKEVTFQYLPVEFTCIEFAR